ncbi:hypothetical protein [Geomonas subterranea]|uniref:Uncharacterized protein n=1 Tax=Geomonas subterranea TaxID=2847989 RepID=A0ABX8LKE0_9BACT|nr:MULTISPECIES: hypothetical protein [Geomonas]QXE91381.1 hypothetical protein KP001_02215 [Geomonas subterranea]QXM10532.1 hypothetical protein KP002_05280 [Geomonas subterranea]
MDDLVSEGGGDAAVAILEQILRSYAAVGAALSPDGGPDLVQPVTEVARGSYRFAAVHFMEVRVDEYVEVVPVRCTATVSPARGSGFRVELVCHTNLEEPDYSYWEFRDFLKELSANGYLGAFSLGSSPWYSHGCSRQVLCYQYRFPAGQGEELPVSLAYCVLGGMVDDIFHAATSYFQHFWYYLEHDGSWSRRPGYDQRPAVPTRVIQFPGYRRNKQS